MDFHEIRYWELLSKSFKKVLILLKVLAIFFGNLSVFHTVGSDVYVLQQ